MRGRPGEQTEQGARDPGAPGTAALGAARRLGLLGAPGLQASLGRGSRQNAAHPGSRRQCGPGLTQLQAMGPWACCPVTEPPPRPCPGRPTHTSCFRSPATTEIGGQEAPAGAVSRGPAALVAGTWKSRREQTPKHLPRGDQEAAGDSRTAQPSSAACTAVVDQIPAESWEVRAAGPEGSAHSCGRRALVLPRGADLPPREPAG